MNKSKLKKNLWLYLSLLVAVYYGAWFYIHVFSHQYIVQDDARQHVVWLQRLVDPELFPRDIIADYFQALAPLGFKNFYKLLANVGLEPILVAKLLAPILGIITTIYLYFFTLAIVPIPLTGFIACLLFNQLIWLNDDLVSATARAFIYPLFTAFLYYLARKSLIPCLILMLLQGLFYPHVLLIEMAVLSLRLIKFKRPWRINLTTLKQPYIWWLAGIIITAIALYPITQKPAELATTVTAEQMRQIPEFSGNGRNPFFYDDWFNFWLFGSGGLSLPVFPTIVWTGIALPFLLKTKLSIAKLVTQKVIILQQVVLASLLMFCWAHLLLPRLHLPSRYTYHTLQLILAIAAAIVLTIIIDLIRTKFKRQQRVKIPFKTIDKLKFSLIILLGMILIIVPAIPSIFINGFQAWKIGTDVAIYQYLAQQPKNIMVASLSRKANNIPAFSQRSILVGREFAMAYHPSYHQQIKQRVINLLQAQYTSDSRVLNSFIDQYQINYFLLDKNAFDFDYFERKKWLIYSSWREVTEQTIKQLKSGTTSALTKAIAPCQVVSTQDLILVDAACVKQSTVNSQQLSDS